MFGHRYFGKRVFGIRYFAAGGSGVVTVGTFVVGNTEVWVVNAR
jgi:hypothetical protein